MFSFWSQPRTHGCDTIVDFIDKCMENSKNGHFMYFLRGAADNAINAPMPVLLLYPVSRLVDKAKQAITTMMKVQLNPAPTDPL